MVAEVTAMVPLGDREIEMRKPTDGAVIVLAKIFKRTAKIENAGEMTDQERERALKNIGVLGDIVDSMIVDPADVEWLEEALIAGTVAPEEAFVAIRVATEKINGTTAPAKKTAPVRRRAGNR